ncbi:Uncharacterized protein TCM_014026 [Theobroma cacao]|uniref:RNase H type-1 domain-containing protein n=1 Tax=Theobroma cacao TaxID=3641 RepID=A0A061FWF7_THECC|nr:Uncharacterized protein TCM_014026 [Theobroma cacao]
MNRAGSINHGKRIVERNTADQLRDTVQSTKDNAGQANGGIESRAMIQEDNGLFGRASEGEEVVRESLTMDVLTGSILDPNKHTVATMEVKKVEEGLHTFKLMTRNARTGGVAIHEKDFKSTDKKILTHLQGMSIKKRVRAKPIIATMHSNAMSSLLEDSGQNLAFEDIEVEAIQQSVATKDLKKPSTILGDDLKENLWPIQGPKFTWRRGTMFERIDKAVCNMQWRLAFSDAVVHHLPRVGSDHRPLLISTRDARVENRTQSFRFQAVWLIHEGFNEFVKQAWDNSSNIHVAMWISFKVYIHSKEGNVLPPYPIRNKFSILPLKAHEFIRRPVDMEEVRETLFEMKPLKAPEASEDQMEVIKEVWTTSVPVQEQRYKIHVKFKSTGRELHIEGQLSIIKSMVVNTHSTWTFVPLINGGMKRQEEILVGWTPPPKEWITVNSDGAYNSVARIASAGRVLRDTHGTWIVGYACKLSQVQPIVQSCEGFTKASSWLGSEASAKLNYKLITRQWFR